MHSGKNNAKYTKSIVLLDQRQGRTQGEGGTPQKPKKLLQKNGVISEGYRFSNKFSIIKICYGTSRGNQAKATSRLHYLCRVLAKELAEGSQLDGQHRGEEEDCVKGENGSLLELQLTQEACNRAKRSVNQVLGKRRIGGYSRSNSCLSYCRGLNVDLKTADLCNR